MDRKVIALFVLRLSIASVFMYAAIASFITPDNWIGYFPTFLRHLIPSQILLTGFSLYEMALSFWLISNIKIFYASTLAAFTLIGIITANFTQLDILFRDFAIILASVSLAIFSYNK